MSLTDTIVEKLRSHKLSENTIKNYTRNLKNLFSEFDFETLEDLNDRYLDIVKFMNSKDISVGSRKSLMTTVSKVFNMYELSNYKNILDALRQEIVVSSITKTDAMNKTTADTVMHSITLLAENFETKYKYPSSDNRTVTTLLALFEDNLTMRPNEVISILFLNTPVLELLGTERTNAMNYYNVDTKEFVINRHKTWKKSGTRRFTSEFINSKYLIHKPIIGKPLFIGKNGSQYEQSTFDRVFKKYFEFNYYKVRKAISNKIVNYVSQTNNIDILNRLSLTNGHSVGVMTSHYTEKAEISSGSESE